jgi:hypothetical protein
MYCRSKEGLISCKCEGGDVIYHISIDDLVQDKIQNKRNIKSTVFLTPKIQKLLWL